MKNVTNIWILQTAFLGDAVLSLPFIYRVLEHYPESKLRVFVTPVTRGIFELALERGLAHARDRLEMVTFDKRGAHRGWRALARFVSEEKRTGVPQIVFCLQRSLRTAVLAWLSGAPVRVGFSSGSAAFLYSHNVAREWHGGRHEIEKNLDLLRAVCAEGVMRWDPRLAPSLLKPVVPGGTQKSPAMKTGNSSAEDLPISIAVGSPWPTKRWPSENAADLVRRLTTAGEKVWLLGDPASVPLAQEVERLAPSFLLKNWVGNTSLREWVDLICASRVLVANDSAAVHVASDLNVPVVALFGPTVSEFGFAPFRPGSKVLGFSNLECRPCGIHGPKACPLGHHRCLKDLGADRVQDVLRNWIPDKKQL